MRKQGQKSSHSAASAKGRLVSSSRARADGDQIDELFGFQRVTEVTNFNLHIFSMIIAIFEQGVERFGWLLNYMPMVGSEKLSQ